MFRASSYPSSGATTAVAASGLPLERGGSSAVGCGRVGILLVDSVESMMMHGLANLKFGSNVNISIRAALFKFNYVLPFKTTETCLTVG
jgi:hypothetical protein